MTPWYLFIGLGDSESKGGTSYLYYGCFSSCSTEYLNSVELCHNSRFRHLVDLSESVHRFWSETESRGRRFTQLHFQFMIHYGQLRFAPRVTRVCLRGQRSICTGFLDLHYEIHGSNQGLNEYISGRISDGKRRGVQVLGPSVEAHPPALGGALIGKEPR